MSLNKHCHPISVIKQITVMFNEAQFLNEFARSSVYLKILYYYLSELFYYHYPAAKVLHCKQQHPYPCADNHKLFAKNKKP